ncbi:Transferase [Macleaya cordata]|uniref:Transferase n=1 Tax=Macleaya cordata TaxID=56857 RepID=A0A200QKS5_MACCD|nr:Transferase [Macleaya cordata]
MGSNRDHENSRIPCCSIPQDLKVTLGKLSNVVPIEETEVKSMFLSNIDQLLNFNVETIHFFEANPDFPFDIVVEKLKIAFRKMLVHYDFLAGRLRWVVHQDQDQGQGQGQGRPRLEIYCNSAGAGFAVASSDLSLAELGDLMYPNPAFQQLVVKNSSSTGITPEDLDQQLLCALQVTSFKCGGFALGIFTNHIAFDGITFKMFLENLASLAANKPMVTIPYNNRQILAARYPPRVTFSHPELINIDEITPSIREEGQEEEQYSSTSSSIKNVFEFTLENLDFKIFRLSVEDISNLKKKAAEPNNNNNNNNNNGTKTITSFNVVTTHIWRCKALVGMLTKDDDDDILLLEKQKKKKTNSTILYAVDLRPRLVPPLPVTFTGNAILNAYATASLVKLEEGPFSHLVQMVSQGATRLTDEYARSVIDWGEIHYKGYPNGDVLVSSWWKLGFSEVDYPWGRPKYSCPIVYHRKDIILLFPDNYDIEGVNDGKGVNVLVALPTKEMEEFQKLFYKFLL